MHGNYQETELTELELSHSKTSSLIVSSMEYFGLSRTYIAFRNLISHYHKTHAIDFKYSDIPIPIRKVLPQIVEIKTKDRGVKLNFTYNLTGEFLRNMVQETYDEFFFQTDFCKENQQIGRASCRERV